MNGTEDDTKSKSLITLGDKKIENVEEFKYLGVKIAPRNDNIMMQHRIATATSKFAEMKDMFKNHRINVKTRTKFLNSFVRSRLAYNCGTLFNATSKIQKLEVEWTRFLRKLVKGGMARKNSPPKNISELQKKEGKWDYSFKYSNAEIHNICGLEPLQTFIGIQHMKWLAHVIRMDNSTLEKQPLLMDGTSDIWKSLEDITYLDRNQLRRTMFCKKTFDDWLKKFKK